MANKRETSSQRRQRENRARRAALEARTKGAPPARPSRVAPSTAEKLKRSAETKATSPAASSADAPADGKKAKGAKRVRPPRPGDKPVDVATLEGSWYSKIMHVPGGTQVLFATVMAVVATGLMSFTKVFVSEADKDLDDPKATQTVWQAFDVGQALLLVGIPLAITAFALWATLRPQRRRVWLVAAVLLGALSLMYLQLYLIVAGFLAYAIFRAAKVEGPNEPLLGSLFGRNRRSRADADTEAAVDPDGEVADEALDLRESSDDGGADADEPDGPIVQRRGFFSR